MPRIANRSSPHARVALFAPAHAASAARAHPLPFRSATGTTTNNTAGNTACRFTLPGFGSNSTDNGTPTLAYACLADTYAPAIQGPVPTNCTPCADGLSTNGAAQQAACLWVKPGYAYTTATGVATACPQDFYASGTRSVAANSTCIGW